MIPDAIKDALNDPTKIGILRLSLGDKIPANSLSYIILAIDDLYFGHLWLTMAEKSPVGAPPPDPYMPNEKETLYINRIEIGTPNYFELIGSFSLLAPVIGLIANIFRMPEIIIKIKKGLAESQKLKAEKDKLEAETEKIRLETKLLRLELSERARPLFMAGKITEAQLYHKTEMENNARLIIQNDMIKYAKDPELNLIYDTGSPNQKMKAPGVYIDED